MLGTVALTFALTPKALLVDTAPRIDMEASIPEIFGDWSVDPAVTPISASPEQKETLDLIYDQMVSRTYVNSKGHRIMLSVAHGAAQNRQLRVHRQEVCYAAQGFQIKEIHSENIRLAGADIPMTRMIAVHGQRTEPVTYWFTMGDFLVRSHLDRQIVQLKYAFSGFVPDGYLFRVSSLASDSASAFTEQLAFSGELLRAMDRRLAEKLIGRAPAQ